MIKLNCGYTIKKDYLGRIVKVNKVWFLIILICLVFFIHGEYYKIYISLFIGLVGISASIICMLSDFILQFVRNQRIKK